MNKIAYLNYNDSVNLEYDTPCSFDPESKDYDGEQNRIEAILNHHSVTVYTPDEFVNVFNELGLNGGMSGFIAIIE